MVWKTSLKLQDAPSYWGIYRVDLVAMEFLRYKMDCVPINCQLSCFFPEMTHVIGEWQGWIGIRQLI